MYINEKVKAGTRIGSMIIDHFTMTSLAMLFFIPGMISSFSMAFEISHEQTGIDIFGGFLYFGVFGFSLYFSKDSIKGRSVGKRALKLQVVENSSGKVASPIRCFIRNIFVIIWPLEVLVTLINPSRRIGDLVAGTKVVAFHCELEQPKVNFKQLALSIGLGIGLLILVILPFKGLNSMFTGENYPVVKSSLNENSAQEMEQLFTDSLGAYMTSDILVYDRIKGEKDKKYVSVILMLNDNYINTDEDYDQLHSVTMPLLYAKFPKGTFVGQIKYVYNAPGTMQMRSVSLD